MKYIFELSKEHKTIPKYEIINCLNAEKIKYKIIESNNNVLIVNIYENKLNNIPDRLSFTFFIDKFLFSSKTALKDIRKNAVINKIKTKGTIAIKYKNRSENIDSKPIIKTLAEIYTQNRIVSLENPDIEVRCIITDSKIYVGIKISEINRTLFEGRKAQFRPFFSPISMHPKLARALVNLSKVKKGDFLLDPFCGTGGILIEAGLMGIKLIGIDIKDKMIEGCQKNLDFLKIKNYKLFCSDIGNILKYVSTVDAVVTDLPYGKSTTTKGENMEDLYKRAFKIFSKVLKKDARAVIGLPNKDMIIVGEEYLSFIEKHEIKAHNSLTRYFVVFKK